MNKVQLTGRLTAEPEIRYSNGNPATCIARFRLAVDRRFKREGDSETDFIGIVAFGKLGEHVERYYHKGMKVGVTGRIRTGSYDHKDGYKVYTTDIIAEDLEFEERRDSNGGGNHGGGIASENEQTDGCSQQGRNNQGQQKQAQGGGQKPQQGFRDGFMPMDDDEGLHWG